MSNSFSVFFASKLNASVVNSVTYTLIVGSLNCTDEMLELPKIKRETDQVLSEKTIIKLARSDALVNSLSIQSFSWFKQPATFNWGFVTASGTEDTIQLLAGHVKEMAIVREAIEIGISDKNDIFSQIPVGSLGNPSNGSLSLPHEQWWNLMTAEGGLSDLKDVSNPDIDYDAWLNWSDYEISQKSSTGAYILLLRMSEGSNLLDLQTKAVKLASAAVFHDCTGRLVTISWDRRTIPGLLEITDSDIIGDIETNYQDDQMVNRMTVGIHWGAFNNKLHHTHQSSYSITSWGPHTAKIDYNDMCLFDHDWVSSGIPYNNCGSVAAFRMLKMVDRPEKLIRYKFAMGLSGLKYSPEDALTLVTSRDLLGSRDLTVRKVEYDLDKGLVNFVLVGRRWWGDD